MWIVYTLTNGDDELGYEWEDMLAINSLYVALDIQQFHEYTLGAACYISQD